MLLLLACFFFSPKGWDNIAQGAALGNRHPVATQPEGLRHRRLVPALQAGGWLVTSTRGVAPGYVVPPLRGKGQNPGGPRHSEPFGNTCFAFAQPKTDYPALKQRLQRGNYAEARGGFEQLVKEEKPQAAAFVGLALCLRAEGEYTRALDALDAGLKVHPDDPTLLAERADLRFFLGLWDDATKDAEAAIKKQDGNFLARWVRARVLRDRGDLAAADKEVRWFVKTYTDASQAKKDITDAELLLIVGLAGAENARWNNKPEQFAFILNEVYKDALKADPDCWQAENQAGRLLLEKHNRADAADAFDKALKINPKAVEALVGKGLLALAELDSATAARFADQALAVNPRHPEALRLKADARLAEGDSASAERLLLAAKLVNPREEPTLARLAAVGHLARKVDAVAAVEKEVAGFCAKPGVFYHELAEVLAGRKQYAKAEECYKRAAELRPDLSGPRAGLGLLLMQLGREPEAKLQLEAAFKADPFHVRVSNALKVLKHLDGYETRETAHFVIKFDPKNDKVLAAWLADYLEELHGEFSKLYGFAPQGKILVEVMASREMFSGRVLSLPGLPGAAQGASTGPLIAVPSPRADGATKHFNWAVVVRHELTHAFNLTQTGYLVPIWLTEGLAVRAERTRRFDIYTSLLRDRLAEGTAFDLDTIGRGYHNFGNPADVMLAYHQGWLYVEYIAKTYGEESVAKLLEAFKLGLDTGDAVRRACGVDKAALEKGYREFLRAAVKGLPRYERPVAFNDLLALQKKNPDDPDLAARLAAEYARRSKPAEAKKLADLALAKEKGHPVASIVKARLLQREQDAAGARAVLEEAVKANPEDMRVLTALGRILVESNEPQQAVQWFEAIRNRGTPETEVLDTLAKLYAMLKKDDALANVLADLAARNPDELDIPLRLAKLHRDAGRDAMAETWAREALFVDVLNDEARAILVAALRAQKKDAEAAKVEARYR
jgi:cellulose synthase operon protein C